MAQGSRVQILDSLATAVRGIVDDVTDVAVQVEGRIVVNPSPPTVDFFPGNLSRDPDSAAFSTSPYGHGGYLFTCRARVDTGDNLAAQDLLLDFMEETGPLSLAEAVCEDQSLGGLVTSITVSDPTGYVEYPIADGLLVGFEFTVNVIPALS